MDVSAGVFGRRGRQLALQPVADSGVGGGGRADDLLHGRPGAGGEDLAELLGRGNEVDGGLLHLEGERSLVAGDVLSGAEHLGLSGRLAFDDGRVVGDENGGGSSGESHERFLLSECNFEVRERN